MSIIFFLRPEDFGVLFRSYVYTKGIKMTSEEGQKHIYAQEHQLYYYYNNVKGLLTFNFNYVFQKKQLHLNSLQLFIHWLSRQRAKMYFSPLICLF